jgi:CBS-domain-containing membrane protein
MATATAIAPPDKPPVSPPPPPAPSALARYAAKWRGVPGAAPMPPAPASEAGWAFLGCTVSIALLAIIPSIGAEPWLLGSFGATAVLLYGVPAAPLAQPRHVMGGHVLSAFIGVAAREALLRGAGPQHGLGWLAAALSVGGSTAAMMALGWTHPPGAASALIAATSGDTAVAWGWLIN